jgi:hypothetical protein
MRKHVVRALVGASATLVLALAHSVSPAQAAPARAASLCSIGDAGISYNQLGEAAQFKRLRALQGMNCSSARYVLNDWLRRTYEESYSHKLPRRFYDGYVTWYCAKLTRKKWRCDEYQSDTAFRFVAYRI